MFCHQIISGAVNDGNFTFCNGNIDGYPFVAYGSGNEVIILDKAFNQIQVVSDAKKTQHQNVVCLDCSKENGTIVVSYGSIICILDVLHQTPTIKNQSNYQFSWKFSQVVPLNLFVYTISLYKNKFLAAGSALTLWELKSDSVQDTEESDFMIGEDNETEQSIVKNGDKSIKQNWCQTWEKVNIPNNVTHIEFSPDGQFFASRSKDESSIHIWYAVPNLGFDSVSLQHPSPVLFFEWRQTSHYMPEGTVANCLMSTGVDGFIRVWRQESTQESAKSYNQNDSNNVHRSNLSIDINGNPLSGRENKNHKLKRNVHTIANFEANQYKSSSIIDTADETTMQNNVMSPIYHATNGIDKPGSQSSHHKLNILKHFKHFKQKIHSIEFCRSHVGKELAGKLGTHNQHSHPPFINDDELDQPTFTNKPTGNNSQNSNTHLGFQFIMVCKLDPQRVEKDVLKLNPNQDNYNSTCPIVPHWLNNKEFHFTLRSERILLLLMNRSTAVNTQGSSQAKKGVSEMTHDTDHHQVASIINSYENNVRTLSKSASFDSTISNGGGQPGPRNGHSTNYSLNASNEDIYDENGKSAFVLDKQVIHEIELLLRDWHKSVDLLYAIHPQSRDLLIWKIEWLDCQMISGLLNQPKITLVTNMVQAMMPKDCGIHRKLLVQTKETADFSESGRSLLFADHSLLLMDHIKKLTSINDQHPLSNTPLQSDTPIIHLETEVWSQTYFDNFPLYAVHCTGQGTLSLWMINYMAKESEIPRILNTELKAQVYGHTSKINALISHPTLPLLLSASEKECIIWRMESLGPLGYSGGLSQLFVQKFPSPTQDNNIDDKITDDRANKIPFMYIWLPPIYINNDANNINHLSQKNIFSINFARMDPNSFDVTFFHLSSNPDQNLDANLQAFAQLNLQTFIPNLKQAYIKLLHVFEPDAMFQKRNDPLYMNMLSNLTQNVDYYIVLVVFLDSSPQKDVQPGLNNINGSDEEMDSGYYIYVWTLNLFNGNADDSAPINFCGFWPIALPMYVDIITISAVDALDSPYSLVIACSDATVRFLKCVIDPYTLTNNVDGGKNEQNGNEIETGRQVALIWREWNMPYMYRPVDPSKLLQHRRGTSSIKLQTSCVALAIAPFYDGRICCIIPPNTSLRWRKIGSLNDEILSHPRETEQKIFKVLIFECESSGGSDWILEDKFTLPILNPFISDAITMEMLNSKNKTPQDYSDDELYVERFYANPGRYIKVQWLPCQDGTYLLLIITRNMKIHHNQQDEINLRKGTQVLSYIAWLYGYFPYGAANFNMARSDYIYQHSNKGIPNIASTGDANNNSPTSGGTQNKWILMARTCIASATSEYLLSQQKSPEPHRIMDAEQEMEGDPSLCPPILASWIRNGAFIFSADQALKCFTHCWNTKYMSQLVLPPFEPTISSNVDSNINAANNNSHIKRIMDDINVGTTLVPKSKHKVSHRSKTSPYKRTTSQKQSTPNSSNQPLEIGNANRKLSSHIKKISKLGSKTHLPALLAASNVFNQNAEISTSKIVDKDMTQPPLKIVNDVSSEVGSNRRMSVNPPKAPPNNVSESNSSNYKNVANLANTLASIAARFDPFSEYRMASLDNMAADLGESVLFSPGSHNLFESLFLAGKLPQYHPKQLVELLGCGQIERVVLILGYLTRYLRLNDRAKAAAAMRSKAEHVSLQGTRNRAASLAISTLQLDSMNLNSSEKSVSDTNNAKKRTALPKKQPDIFVKLPEFTGDIGYFELECIPPLPLFVLQSLSYKTQEIAGKTEVLSHVSNPPQTPYKGILKQDKSLTQDIKRKLSTSPQAISAQSTIESSKSNFNALRRRSRSRTKSISLMDKKMTFQTSSSKEDLHSDAELGPKDNKLIEQTSMEELEFGRTEIDILTQYLTKISLPLLTAQEQMQLLALADTIVWVMDQARLDRNLNSGATKIPPITSTEENFNAKTDVVPNIVGSEMEVVANPLIQPESLDGPGLRYCIALRQFNYVNRSSGRGPIRNPQNSARFNSLSASGLGGDAPTIGNEQSVKMTYMKSSAFAWAFHSNSQKGCLSNIPIFQKGNYTWLDFKRYGCGWWVKDPVVLTSLIESIGRQAFQANKNALDAALFYIILNKKAVLQGLFRSVGEMKMYDFFRRDFVNDMDARKAASKNAFALLGKHKYELAVAFFLLSQNVNDAIQVCLKNLKDLQLALVICRLFPVITQTTEDGQQNVNLMPTKIETLKKAPGSLIGFGRRPSQPQNAETFDFNPNAFGGSHPVSNDGNTGGNENTTNDTKSQGNLMEKRDTRSIYDGSTIQTYRPTRLEKRFLHMLICADPLYQQIYGDTDHPNSIQNVSITDSSDEQSTDLLSELPSHAFDEATSLRRGDPFILSIALWRLGKRDRALYVFLRAIAPPKFYKRSAQQPGQKKLSIDGNVDPSTFHESQKSSPENFDIDQTKVVDSSAKKIGQKVLPSSDSSNSLDLKDNLTNGHMNGQDTEVVPRKKRHSNVRFQDASAIATENGLADKPAKSTTSGKYGRRRASSITETREAPSSFFLSIDRLYDITSIFNFYSYLRKKLAMLNPNSPIAMYPNVLSTQERHLYFACAYTYIKIGCPMLALQILEKLSRKQTQEMNSLNAAIQSWNSYSSTSAGSPILPSNNDANNFTDESQSTELTPTIPARDHTLQSLKWLACLCLLCQGLVNTFGNTDFCEADLIDSEEEGSNDHNGKKSPRSDKGQRKESIVYDPDTPSSSDNESTEKTNESPQIRTKKRNGKILSSFNERLNRKMVKTRESTLRVWLRFYIWLQGEIQAISQFCCPNDFAINQTSIHLAIVETLYDFICLRRPIGMLAFAKMQLLTILNDKLINDDIKTLEVEQRTNQNYNNINPNSETEKDSDIGIINSLPPLLVHRIICPTFSHSNKNINSSTTTNATLFFEDPFEYLQNTCFDIMKGLTSFAATKGVYDSALGTEKGTSTSSQQGANNVKESPPTLITSSSPPASASITEQNTNALLSTILCLQDTAHSLSACLFQALTPLNMWCEKKLLHLRVKKISDQYQRNARPSKADILKQMKNWHTTTKDSGKKSAITVTQTDEMKNIDCGEDLPCVYVTKDFLEAVCVGEFDVILNFWWQNFGAHLHADSIKNAISEKAPSNNESMMIIPQFYKLNILEKREFINVPQKLVMNFNQDDSNYYHQQNLLGNIVFVTPTNSERREPDNHQSTQLNSPTNDAINQMTLDDLANCTEIKNWPDIHNKKGNTKGLSTAQVSGSIVLESSQELKLFLAECLLAIHGSCFITALLTYDACLLYRLVCLKLDSHLWNTTFGFTLHGFMPIQIRQSAQPNAPEMNNQENNENVFDEDTSSPDGETSASNDGKRNSTDINHKIKFWMPPVKPLFATIFQKPSEKNGLPMDILDYDSDVGLDDEDGDGTSIPNSPVFSPLSKSNESLASSFTSNNDSIMGDDEMQHSNPHSFTWTLIKLACIRAMLAEISSFLATILLGPRSLTSTDSLPCRTSPRIHAYICMLEDWEKTLAKRLYNFFERSPNHSQIDPLAMLRISEFGDSSYANIVNENSPTENDNNPITKNPNHNNKNFWSKTQNTQHPSNANGGDNGNRLNQIYQDLLDPNHTPFTSNSRSVIPIKRLWLRLVRDERTHHLFVRFIIKAPLLFAPKSPQTMNNSQALPSSDQKTNAKTSLDSKGEKAIMTPIVEINPPDIEEIEISGETKYIAKGSFAKIAGKNDSSHNLVDSQMILSLLHKDKESVYAFALKSNRSFDFHAKEYLGDEGKKESEFFSQAEEYYYYPRLNEIGLASDRDIQELDIHQVLNSSQYLSNFVSTPTTGYSKGFLGKRNSHADEIDYPIIPSTNSTTKYSDSFYLDKEMGLPKIHSGPRRLMNGVRKMASHPSQDFYLTGDVQGCIKVWRWEEPHFLEQFNYEARSQSTPKDILQHRITALKYSPYGYKIGALHANGQMLLYNSSLESYLHSNHEFWKIQAFDGGTDFKFLASESVLGICGLSNRGGLSNLSIYDTLLPDHVSCVQSFCLSDDMGSSAAQNVSQEPHSSSYSPILPTVLCYLPSNPNIIFVATQRGNVQVLDLRYSNSSLHSTTAAQSTTPIHKILNAIKCHETPIKCMALDQSNEQFLVTGSSGGNLKVWSLPHILSPGSSVASEHITGSGYNSQQHRLSAALGLQNSSNPVVSTFKPTASQPLLFTFNGVHSGSSHSQSANTPLINATASRIKASAAKLKMSSGGLNSSSASVPNLMNDLARLGGCSQLFVDDKARIYSCGMDGSFKIRTLPLMVDNEF